MTRQAFVLAGLGAAFVACAGAPAVAADVPVAVLKSAACAPPPATAAQPERVLQVVGSQDTRHRSLFGAGELVIVNGGTAAGVSIGQQYVVRRRVTLMPGRDTSGHPISTVAQLKVVSVNDTTAIALIEVMCDGVVAGDYLEPFVPVSVPDGVERSATAGELEFKDLDFSKLARVVSGREERAIGATADFMIADAGEEAGIAPGQRFAIYRDVRVPEVPLTAIGEAIVVTVSPERSVIRITKARDAVQSGDLLVPRSR